MKEIDYSAIEKEIHQLEKEISEYPIGSISKKTINGKEQYYHQWYELGKTKSKYMQKEDAEKLKAKIELRKRAQAKLNELKEKLSALTEGKKLKTSISIPYEITGTFDGRCIIPDKTIKPSIGQKILITIRDSYKEKKDINLDQFINQGERLFTMDAQEYIRELRDEERV